MNYIRVPPAIFYELLQRITPRIQKSERYRRPLEHGLRLAITLRYIVTGNSYKSLQYSFRVAHNTIALFIPEVCQAIIDEHQNEVFAFPTNQEEWREVAQKFGERWNFYHTCGTLDGKHVAIKTQVGLVLFTTTTRCSSASSFWPWSTPITSFFGTTLVINAPHQTPRFSKMPQ